MASELFVRYERKDAPWPSSEELPCLTWRMSFLDNDGEVLADSGGAVLTASGFGGFSWG